MRRFEDKVAVVTGASRGIGRAIAMRLATEGARVVVSSRDLDACARVVTEIRAGGGTALAVACNVSHHDHLASLVDATRQTYGGIDALICNAAINPYYGPLSAIPDAAYDKTMSANVRSTLWLCNLVVPGMAARGGGAVVAVGSIAGLRGSASIGAYSMSKAAMLQLVRNLAVEWGPRHVRVNAVAPGLIRTDFAKARWTDPARYAETVKSYPLGRIGEPDEVAAAVAFLAAPEAGFITGHCLVVDGGVTIGGG